MLQVIKKKQVISECENRARFLYCLSLQRKGHPSGGIHAPWYLSSEIAALRSRGVRAELIALCLGRYGLQHEKAYSVGLKSATYRFCSRAVIQVWWAGASSEKVHFGLVNFEFAAAGF
jgi:hypothetical protein